MPERSRRRHVHLGERLEVAARVRSGAVSLEAAARRLRVDASEVASWVATAERPVSVDDVLVPHDVLRLTRRAQRLVALIEAAEAVIRALSGDLAKAVRG
jgi:RNA:NAD 2'-phosphotransferase (TPT1/KptA family)